nr:hypothetical protein [Maliibacterium massiliense]
MRRKTCFLFLLVLLITCAQAPAARGASSGRQASICADVLETDKYNPGGLIYRATARVRANKKSVLIADIDIYNLAGRRIFCGPRQLVRDWETSCSEEVMSPELCHYASNTWRIDAYTGRVRAKFHP